MPATRWFAALAATIVAGTLVVSASTLGGLGARSLGAAGTTVVPCDGNGITISYLNDYDAVADSYRTVEVALGDVDAACQGLAYRLTLAGGSGSIRELTGTVALNGGTRMQLPLSPSIDAAAIARASLVVTG